MFIIVIFWLGCDRPSGLHFSCPLCFFPYSRLSSNLLRLFRCLISFLLFPCASVWENTLAWVPHFLLPLVYSFFTRRNSPCFGRCFPYWNLIILILTCPSIRPHACCVHLCGYVLSQRGGADPRRSRPGVSSLRCVGRRDRCHCQVIPQLVTTQYSYSQDN